MRLSRLLAVDLFTFIIKVYTKNPLENTAGSVRHRYKV